MAVLIEGMEMPKGELGAIPIMIYANGNVEYFFSHEKYGKVIEVPEPHGRLIDADALAEDLKRQCEEVFKIDAVSPDDFWITRDQAYNERLWKTWCESFFEYLKTRETIITASRRAE